MSLETTTAIMQEYQDSRHIKSFIFMCVNCILFSQFCFMEILGTQFKILACELLIDNQKKLQPFVSYCFCCALSFMSWLPSSFTWIPSPTVSLGKTKSPGIKSFVVVRVQFLEHFCWLLVEFFLSWLRQNFLLSSKDNMFSSKLFLQFIY